MYASQPHVIVHYENKVKFLYSWWEVGESVSHFCKIRISAAFRRYNILIVAVKPAICKQYGRVVNYYKILYFVEAKLKFV